MPIIFVIIVALMATFAAGLLPSVTRYPTENDCYHVTVLRGFGTLTVFDGIVCPGETVELR